MIKITLNQDVTLHGTGPFTFTEFKYRAGEEIEIARVDWPGKPYWHDTILYGSGKKNEVWRFCTHTQTTDPAARVFYPKQIESLTCPDLPGWRGIFKDAPFKVNYLYQENAVQKDLILRFGSWLASKKEYDRASAKAVEEAAEMESDIMGLVIHRTLFPLDFSQRLLLEERMLEDGFTKEEIDHIFRDIPLQGPYEWSLSPYSM